MDWNVLATAAVGIAGIAAAFFAPVWTQRKLEQRRETDFRRASRLVTAELSFAEAYLRLALREVSKGQPMPPPSSRAASSCGATGVRPS